MLRISAWWRGHRLAAPDLFDEDIAQALALLAQSPYAGVVTGDARRRDVRRLSLEHTRLHIYYRVDESKQLVRVLEVWHQSRGRAPKV